MDERDECVSLLEMTSAISSDVLQDLESQNYDTFKRHSGKCNKRNEESIKAENMTDFENYVPAICIETSDDEDAFDRLPINNEDTGSGVQFVTDVEPAVGHKKESAAILRDRTQKLWSEMTSLRKNLNREVALWKKEREEFQHLREQSDALAFEEAAAAARAAAAAYAVESPLSNDLVTNIGNTVEGDITAEQSISKISMELAILEYEKNLAKYQNPYSLEQAEQRYNLYKHTLVEAYKQRLLEIERLCDEELKKLRENANCLQPFKEIVSQWSIDKNNHGDSNGDYGVCEYNTEQSKIAETDFDKSDCYAFGKVDNEVNMVPEILSARFKKEDMA